MKYIDIKITTAKMIREWSELTFSCCFQKRKWGYEKYWPT